MILICSSHAGLNFLQEKSCPCLTNKGQGQGTEVAEKQIRQGKHLQTSKSELFGNSFMKAVQHDAKSVELNTIQYLQNQSKRPKQPFHGGSTARQRTNSSSYVERSRAAPASNRGKQGNISDKNEQNTCLQHTTETS